MRKHIKGIDHVVIAARDLDSTQETFRRMGFTLTPRGHHTLGSENHCVVFGQDYFELLMVPQRLPGREYYYDFARIGDGLAAIALKTDNARGAFGELTAAALAPSEPVDFSRPVQIAGGTKTASFRITQLGLEQTPGGQVFLCQHFTRDVVWRPEYQTHANTATGLAALAIVSADVGATAAAYERLFDVKARAINEGLLIDTGDTPIAVVSEPGAGEKAARNMDQRAPPALHGGAVHPRRRSRHRGACLARGGAASDAYARRRGRRRRGRGARCGDHFRLADFTLLASTERHRARSR